MVRNGKIAFVEVEYPSKWISRLTPDIEISRGNHSVSGVAGPLEENDQIVCLRAPLRSRDGLLIKAADSRRLETAGPGEAWQYDHWKRMKEENRIEEEWKANSYTREGLEVDGSFHSLIHDPTLRNVAARAVRAAG